MPARRGKYLSQLLEDETLPARIKRPYFVSCMYFLLRNRTLYFFTYWVLSLFLFQQGLASLVALGLNDDRYSHILLLPLVCVGFIWFAKKKIFAHIEYFPWAAAAAVFGIALYFAAVAQSLITGPSERLLLAGFAILLTWAAGFVLFYGVPCAKRAVFPLSLLLFSIPIPPRIVEIVEVALQRGSAEATHFFFQIFSTPVYREGMVFSLPGMTIEVAKECSGIRAAIALFITAVIVSYLFLRTLVARACCLMLVLPIAIVKNAARIAILSWLSIYVSKDYLTGSLHHSGGALFSMISLALLLGAIWIIRKYEHWQFREDVSSSLQSQKRGEAESREIQDVSEPLSR